MANVEVDEVLRLCGDLACAHAIGKAVSMSRTMRDKAAEVPTHDTVPRSAFTLIELKTR